MRSSPSFRFHITLAMAFTLLPFVTPVALPPATSTAMAAPIIPGDPIPGGPLPGGFSPASANDPDVQAAAVFAVEAIQSSLYPTESLNLSAVVSASLQVVAGAVYSLVIDVNVAQCGDAMTSCVTLGVRKCSVTVLVVVWQHPTTSLWNPAPVCSAIQTLPTAALAASTTTQPASTTTQPASTTTQPASTTTQSASTTTQSASAASIAAESPSITTQSASNAAQSASTATQSASTATQSASTGAHPGSTATQSASNAAQSASITTQSASSTQSTNTTTLQTEKVLQRAF